MVDERNKALDVAKGITIVLMVLGHADGIGNIVHFISLFHMAVFVYVSGYLFKEINFTCVKDLICFIYKKIKKLYLFYLKWELLFYLMRNIFFNLGFYNVQLTYGGKTITPISLNKAFAIDILKIFLGMGREPFCGAFWFIISLIIIIIIFTIICFFIQKFNRKESIRFLCVALIFSLGMTMSYIQVINIRRLSPAFSLLLFFYMGYLNKNRVKIKFKNTYLFITSVILLLYLNTINTIGINSNSIVNPIFFITASLSGIYMILYISNIYKNNNFLNYIGRNTMPIIAMHLISFKLIMLIQYFMNLLEFKDLGNFIGVKNIWWTILYTFVGVIIPLIINYLYKRMLRLKKETI